MIVGNGMMAQAFSGYHADSNVVVFASGVSNSVETGADAFRRERDLLVRVREVNPTALLVYFGTCSVYDPDRFATAYVQHKLAMESYLADLSHPWMVLRLPLAIGRGHRGQTLARYLHERISRGVPFEVWTNSTRYPVDVEDVFSIALRLISDRSMWNRRINIALRAFPVLEFVRVMEQIVGKPGVYTPIQKGQHYELERPEVTRLADELGLDFSEEYLQRVLCKYFQRDPAAASPSMGQVQ